MFSGLTLLPKNLFDMTEILNFHFKVLIIIWGKLLSVNECFVYANFFNSGCQYDGILVTFTVFLIIQFQNSCTLCSKRLDVMVFYKLLQRAADENIARSWQYVVATCCKLYRQKLFLKCEQIYYSVLLQHSPAQSY